MGPDHIREIHRVSGSDLGGVKVDQLFMQHLVVLFGEKNITNIKTENLDDWLRIKDDFEKVKKKVISQSVEDKVSLKPKSMSLGSRIF